MSPIHTFTQYYFTIHVNVVLTFICVSEVVSSPGFPAKIKYAVLNSHMRATCPAHLILLDLITLLVSDEEYYGILTVQFSSASCPPFLGSNIVLSSLSSKKCVLP
jgi:hypothetical protein